MEWFSVYATFFPVKKQPAAIIIFVQKFTF